MSLIIIRVFFGTLASTIFYSDLIRLDIHSNFLDSHSPKDFVAPCCRTAAVACQQPLVCRRAWGSQAPGCATFTILRELTTSLDTSLASPHFHEVLRSVSKTIKNQLAKDIQRLPDYLWSWLSRIVYFRDDVSSKDTTLTGMITIMIHWWSSPKACEVCRVFWWEYRSVNQRLKWLNGFKCGASTWHRWKTQKQWKIEVNAENRWNVG